MSQVTPDRFFAAPDFDGYVSAAAQNLGLWRGIYRTARIPSDLVERGLALRGRWHLLVLSEDWCGDAFNSVPVIAKWVDHLANIDVRILARDANPDLMDTHLTGASRSIPVVMVLDEDFVEYGWWGARPEPLRHWFETEGFSLGKSERNKQKRAWYARDRGRTILEEVVQLMERSAAKRFDEVKNSSTEAATR